MRAIPSTLLIAASLVSVSAAVRAQDNFLSVSGSASFVSDYRFRGVSLSDKDPAVQGNITVNTAPGFFAGVWGSSIQDYAGATTEIDVYGGWSRQFGLLTPTVGIYTYLFPGASGVDVYELYGSVAGNLGPATLTVGLNWAPDQGNLNRSSRYVYAAGSVGIPTTPLTLKASIGHERGALVVDPSGQTTSKLDYMVGVDANWNALTLGIAWIGNDLPEKSRFNENAKNSFVVSLTAAF
ncbi:MAG: TorF family putative porin [Sphingomonadaceae bacterium]